ncbi:hypothetical protein LCGC14_0225120 [marine sediment metagenome]|uniref:Uncharacterized protein n=1 Tax=marine sediment metagenome TaxID=412755 RepID=A0A0F9XG93_9ZZZZ
MTHFDDIIKGELEFHEFSEQGKDRIIREICKRIVMIENNTESEVKHIK